MGGGGGWGWAGPKGAVIFQQSFSGAPNCAVPQASEGLNPALLGRKSS